MSSKTTKASKKASFKDVLILKINDYLDQAFSTEDTDKRQKYREAIMAMEQLLLLVSDLE
ncbi:hypothetical protein IKD67_02095 [Candidatus Saccharibacteria bacterium]|nr:hypothetical protein [Candidatus Saccharibacteria bacterium]